MYPYLTHTGLGYRISLLVRQAPTGHDQWARPCVMQGFGRAEEERKAVLLNATYIINQREACTGSCALGELLFVVGR